MITRARINEVEEEEKIRGETESDKTNLKVNKW